MSAQDFAGLFDVSEIGSIIGGVVGSIATRNLTFFKVGGATGAAAKRTFSTKKGFQGLAGETGLGLVGREFGTTLKLLVSLCQGRTFDPV